MTAVGAGRSVERMKTVRNILALAAALLVLGTAGVAAAGNADDGADPYVGPSPSVLSETSVAPAPSGAAVANNSEVASAELAFTGGDVAMLTTVGLLVVAAGGAMLFVRSRRGAEAA